MKAICKICYHYELCKEAERCLPEYLNCNFFKNKLDVVEVVRCKDCKHSFFIKSCSKYECKKGCGSLKYSNDYCSYGERRAENESERLPEPVEKTR